MGKKVITPFQYHFIEELLKEVKKIAEEESKLLSYSESRIDKFEDSSWIQKSIAYYSIRYQELEKIKSGCAPAEKLEEQNDTIKIGNAVIIRNNNSGEENTFIVDSVAIAKGIVNSTCLPCLIGARAGESPNGKFTIIKILPPSEAEKIFWEKNTK